MTRAADRIHKGLREAIHYAQGRASKSDYRVHVPKTADVKALAHGSSGVRQSLAAFIAMKGTLDLKVTRVLEAGGLAFVAGVWSFTGTGSDGKLVTLTGRNGDVLRRQADGSWRFVIDNPWGTD